VGPGPGPRIARTLDLEFIARDRGFPGLRRSQFIHAIHGPSGQSLQESQAGSLGCALVHRRT
jgi:hypothetical protein